MDMKRPRNPPIDLSRSEFQQLGHELVDQIAEFFDTIPTRPLTAGKTPTQIRELIGSGQLPKDGQSPHEFFGQTTEMLFDNSLFNAHRPWCMAPDCRFMVDTKPLTWSEHL